MIGNPDRWYVGQTVLLTDPNRTVPTGPREVEVVKVGRLLVHIEDYGRVRKFDRGTGREHVQASRRTIWTVSDHEDMVRRRDLVAKLQREGVRFDRFKLNPSTELLQDLVTTIYLHKQKESAQ